VPDDHAAGWPTSDTLANLVLDGYLQQLDGWSGDLHWTWTIVESLIQDKPEIAWPMLLELIARCPDGNLNVLAAGPLETFLSEHGPNVIDTVEAEAVRNPRMRHALALVWQLGMTDEVWARVQALAEPGLAERLDREPPGGWEQRHLEVWLEGPIEVASAAWMDRFTAAVRSAKPNGPAPWTTPVSVEVHLQTGREPIATPTVEVLATVAQALVSAGVIGDTAQIREMRALDVRGPIAFCKLTVTRMSDEQVEAIDSAEDPLQGKSDEELRAELDRQLAEIEALRADA
jgi:hypothetical protein